MISLLQAYDEHSLAAIQWLLIGGIHHGRTVWIKYGGKVAIDDELYLGENYLSDGKLYRIGVHGSATFEEKSAVDLLIREKQLQPIGDRK